MLRETRPETLPLDKITEPPHRLRRDIDPARVRELADDMAARGLLQRIRVHPVPGTILYYICAGHRRYLAAKLLGWYDVPAEVAPPCQNCTDGALAENLQRTDLTPVEEADALNRLHDAGHNLGALARLARRSEDWVAGRLALLDHPADVVAAVHNHKLPLAVAALLAQVAHAGYRAYLLNDALAHGATARTVSAWVQHYFAEQSRIEANTDTVEQIAAGRGDYIVLAPCEYCGEHTPLEKTRSWRLCLRCTTELARARDSAPTP